MFFNRRQEPKEFVSSMPQYDEDQDEYYGEEDGDADEGDGYDDEEDEDGDEDEDAAPAKSSGSKNWVKTALMGIAAFALLGGSAYYALLMLAPEVVDEVVNSVTASEPAPDAAPPVDTAAAPPGGEAAAPPPGEAAPPPPEEGQPANAPAGEPAVAPPPPAVPAAKPKPPKRTPMPVPTPVSDLEDIEPVQEPVSKPAPPKPKPKPVPVASKWRANQVAQTRAQQRRAYQAWLAKRNYAASQARYKRTYPRPRPVQVAGTQWIQGQSAYIPWGGGQASAWQRAPKARGASYAYTPPRGRYGVQVGSFANSGNAASLVSQLRSQGIPAYMGQARGGMSRVYVGSYRNLRSAGSAVRKLQNQGIPAAVTAH